MRKKSIWKALSELVMHSLALALGLVAIFVIAILIEHACDFAISAHLMKKDGPCYYALVGLQYTLVISDALLFFAVVAYFGRSFVRSL
jgi:hypothetical protein